MCEVTIVCLVNLQILVHQKFVNISAFFMCGNSRAVFIKENPMVNNDVSTAQHRFSIFIYILSNNTNNMFSLIDHLQVCYIAKTVVQGKLHAFM
jgi:hypothetical protein